MFKKLQLQSGLSNRDIGQMFSEYRCCVINEWQSGAKPAPQSVIDTMHDYIKFKG